VRHRKRDAFLAAASKHGTEKWYIWEVFHEIRPFEKTFFWAGVYPLVNRLESEGKLESGWDDGLYPRRRWYRFRVVSQS
jgi:hypothetical protein